MINNFDNLEKSTEKLLETMRKFSKIVKKLICKVSNNLPIHKQ